MARRGGLERKGSLSLRKGVAKGRVTGMKREYKWGNLFERIRRKNDRGVRVGRNLGGAVHWELKRHIVAQILGE